MPFPTSEEFISEEERRLGAGLPATFRAYLSESNGGEVEVLEDVWQVFPVFDSSERKRSARTANHLFRERDVSRSWGGFPIDALPFADCGSGDRLVFLLESETKYGEAVYLWSHEQRNLEKLAESFNQLVAG